MRPLLKFVMLVLRCLPAFFRSRIEQAIIEFALGQQLATFALKGPKPRITAVDRTFWVVSRYLPKRNPDRDERRPSMNKENRQTIP